MPAATRIVLGLAALASVAAGLVFTFSGNDGTGGGVLIRAGFLLGAAWLVAPLVKRPSLASIGFLAAGALVLIRPRLIVAVAVAAVIWRLSQRRQ